MIEIKATRSQNSTPGSVLAKNQESLAKSGLEKKSTTPIYAGMLLFALGLYLKFSLVTKSLANTPPENNTLPEEEFAIENEPLASLAKLGDGKIDFDDSANKTVEDAIEELNSNAPFSHLTPIEPAGFVLSAFKAYTNFTQPKLFQPASPAPPVNDNFSNLPGQNSGKAAAGGGATEASTDNDATAEKNDDEDGGSATQLNRRPQISGPVLLSDQFVCIMLMFSLSDLLRGATDIDGDALSVKNLSVSNGELELVDGIYHFHSDDAGPVTVNYEITDGKLSVVQTASFNVLAKPPIVGTDEDDVLLGTACADEIIGKDGDDRIDAREGDDAIDGGAGNDHIVGGAGNDVVWGGSGDDVILGNAGNDMLFGGTGNDRIFGGDGNDLIGGDEGNDIIYGDAGNDVIDGGSGNDQLHDGEGQDRANGGEGDDAFIASIDNVKDQFIGGEGKDTLDYSAAESNLVINLVTNEVITSATISDIFASIESFVGGSGDDIFIAATPAFQEVNAVVVVVSEDDFEDSLAESSDVAITYNGGAGTDTLDYVATSEALLINTVEGTVHKNSGLNEHFSNIEIIIGGDGDDLFIVGAEALTLDGHGGDDTYIITEHATEADSPYHIKNFEVGDRINVLRYDIFERDDDEDETSLENMYGSEESDRDETLDSVIPIRVRRHDLENDTYRTFVDVDMDGDETFDISVELDGHHHLIISTHTVA